VSRAAKLTPELHERIVNMIRAGAYPEVAAAACGVGKRTFYEWVARGTKKHPSRPSRAKYRAFAEGVEAATALAEIRLLGKVNEFVEGTRQSRRVNDPRRVKSRLSFQQILAVQWQLSRRFPERWAQRPPAGFELESRDGDEPETDKQTIEIIISAVDADGNELARADDTGGTGQEEIKRKLAAGVASGRLRALPPKSAEADPAKGLPSSFPEVPYPEELAADLVATQAPPQRR
jgi:hypothetical protein